MKKTLLFTALLLLGLQAKTQIFATIEPQFARIGVLYTNMKAPLYGRAWYGELNAKNFHAKNYKIGAGAFIRDKERAGAFIIGINYNRYFDVFDESDYISVKMKPISLDFGFSAKVGKRIWIVMVSDFINWESCIGIGYDLQAKQHIYSYDYKLLR